MTIQDELTIQRLVDGELGEHDRIEYLRSIEHHPRAWRSIALAFVENQVWQSCTVDTAKNEAGTEIAAQEIHKRPLRESKLPASANGRKWWQAYGPRLMLTAAATMFVLTLALRFGPTAHAPGDSPLPEIALPGTENAPAPNLVADEPYKLQIGEVEVPILRELDQFNSELIKTDFDIAPRMQQMLFDAGYQIQPNVRFVSGQTADGRQIIIPIHSWRVRSFRQ